MVTFDWAASERPCSISGTRNVKEIDPYEWAQEKTRKKIINIFILCGYEQQLK